jgi:hypothetical protein
LATETTLFEQFADFLGVVGIDYDNESQSQPARIAWSDNGNVASWQYTSLFCGI